MIRSVQIFDEAWVLTNGGGPGTANSFIVQYIYQNGLRQRFAPVRPGICRFGSHGPCASQPDARADEAGQEDGVLIHGNGLNPIPFLTRTRRAGRIDITDILSWVWLIGGTLVVLIPVVWAGISP